MKRIGTVIAAQLDQVSWLRAGRRQIVVDTVPHALQVRSQPGIVEAITNSVSTGSAATSSIGQQLDGIDLPLHQAKIRIFTNVLSEGAKWY